MNPLRLYYTNLELVENQSENTGHDVYHYPFVVNEGLNSSISNEYGNQIMDSFWNTSPDSYCTYDEGDSRANFESGLSTPPTKQRFHDDVNTSDTNTPANSSASYAHEPFDFKSIKLR
ncbi:hypothetical protein SKDZ_05G2050 [Saccharomyces kudriavzevii ZP591]|uniref:Uncharacterized protein n=1 Tax=Saccharomyces cerevisiae x Saccharomyces kudriavzevii (strain VIN7) TaxID=1095631 RepID=H0GU16_SACCK|nr:hypothetical protein VIN7_6768 [Saccharomyces cerevisiae x Saccharomyces kudriavzevii VIN7]CAI4060588.1 hypothetical protein SKDZ_05G2050 [Saccharomyces kudriavzevii ZP591]